MTNSRPQKDDLLRLKIKQVIETYIHPGALSTFQGQASVEHSVDDIMAVIASFGCEHGPSTDELYDKVEEQIHLARQESNETGCGKYVRRIIELTTFREHQAPKLEKLMPRCKSKDIHDFPGLKPGERCPNCEIWEALDREIEIARLEGCTSELEER